VLYLMLYFLPIALTFVLPMAALFAAALVYGRLASDNELDACRASGISLLTLVYPGLALAIVVAIANLILSFHMVPTFVHRAESALKADAKQILFRNIQRRGYFEPPDGKYLIYADQADSQNDVLLGVVVTELKGNEIKKIVTAEWAKVSFVARQSFNEVEITAYNTYQIGPEDEGGFSVELLPLTKEFPSLLGDDIAFKKIDQMKQIRDVDLLLFSPIERLARRAYVQLTAEVLAEDIAAGIAGDGYYRLHSGRKLVRLTAGQCTATDEKVVELSGDIVVVESDVVTREALWTLQCSKASLHIEGDELAPTLTMDLQNPRLTRPDGSEDLKMRHIIRGLVLPNTVTNKLAGEDILKAVRPASVSSVLRKGPSAELQNLQNELQRKIDRTLAEIEAEIHSRLVFGIGCVPVILIGIGLGIILKGGHLLSAFGASSIPAAVLIVCIMMGKNITKNLGAQAGSGTVLMWSAVGVLILLVMGIYHRLLRN
jgi:lipopolysaccharide export LptBFGC system permease protein LptF